MTQLIQSVTEWRQVQATFSNKSIGFVPTMGNLHVGHQTLLEKAKAENQIAVLSIFVNPTQFDNQNDLTNYPRSLMTDLHLAKELKIDYVFAPSYQDLYPDNFSYQLQETALSQLMEGQYRPGHFTGMLTVVLKLLLIINPQRAYFGEKDYQQLQLVRGLVQAFFLNTAIVACPTIRLNSGLPYSSRNSLLSEAEKQQADFFPKIFHSKKSCAEIMTALNQHGFMVDYVTEIEQRRFAAVRLGKIRLIDNIAVENQS